MQTLLGVGLEAGDVVTGFRLALLEGIQQLLDLDDAGPRAGLRLGLALGGRGLEAGAGLVQLVLGLAALLLQLGQQLLGIHQCLTAGLLQMLEQAVGQLLQQVQRSGDRLFPGCHEDASGR
ncbi:hypothetical protein D3C81_1545880 [compost metagenome]